MRSKNLKALTIGTGLLLLFGCGDQGYDWGVPYAPGADGGGEDDDAPADEDEEDDADDEESGDSEDPPEDDADGGSTGGGPPDPTVDPSAGESTGVPEDSSDTGESPYQGGWDIGNCQDSQRSDVADFSLTDQYGDSVRLYDFCHKAILLTAGSFW